MQTMISDYDFQR